MNKKNRNVLIVVGIILLAVFIIYVGFGKPFTFYLPQGMQHFQYALISETPQYYEYHLTWDSTQPETQTCENQELVTPFSFTTSHNVLSAPISLFIYGETTPHVFGTGDSPYLPFVGNPYGLDSVPRGVKFTSTDVTLNGVTAIANCNTNPVSVPFTYIEKQIECEMQPPQSSFREDATGYLFCTWSGHIKANDGTSTLIVRGLSSGSANITMYKTGFSPPESLVSVYRFGNNQCSYITVLPSEKTVNDYLTLQECQTQIIQNQLNQTLTNNQTENQIGQDNTKQPDITVAILIIIGVILLVALLIFIYIKTRRR